MTDDDKYAYHEADVLLYLVLFFLYLEYMYVCILSKNSIRAGYASCLHCGIAVIAFVGEHQLVFFNCNAALPLLGGSISDLLSLVLAFN